MRSSILPVAFTRHGFTCIACGCCLFFASTRSSTGATFTESGTAVLGGVNYSGRSASLADIDNDGDLDLFFQGAPTAGIPVPRLLRNNLIETGSLTFTDISSVLPLALTVADPNGNSTWSAAWGDYNGDGKIDVFVGKSNVGITGTLLKNNTTTTGGVTTIAFSDESVNVGLNDPGFHQNVAWVDINNDRHLDLLIGMEGPEKHEIYLQDSTGHFSKAGASSFFQQDVGTKAYGMAIGDTDGDGDLDVYISTCRGDNNIRNNFYKNMYVESGAAKTLSFVDIADTNGTQFTKNSYGAEFADFDNDGDLDLYMTGADGERTKIFRNDGGNVFTDVETVLGHALLSSQGVDLNGSKAIDYDNDGDLDLYFHDNLSTVRNQRLFRNDGNWNFTDVTVAEGLTATGLGGYDSVWGDIDRDGDQDLIDPTNTGTPERVYLSNASTNGNHWLYVKLVGPDWDTSGIGSSLYATMIDGSLQGVTLRREANTNADTFNQSDVPVHFGLGTSSIIDWLRVVWPDGNVQFLHNVAVDQYLTISYIATLPGDFNGDLVVDAADYVIWRKNFGSPFNMNDYKAWRTHFGESQTLSSSLATSNAVPEPASAWLALAAAFTGAARTRRRRTG